mmetsp:Transcript_64151/g.157814  ORF Transcript_64151/g.157814 Transcript_64151/m.157814 type:complete len:501 (+) Transcript_64151:565-2067(+)
MAFYIPDQTWEYSTPLIAMWMGLGAFWHALMLLVWWVGFSAGFNRRGHHFQRAYSVVIAIMSLVCMFSSAASRNEAAAAGTALLPLFVAVIGAGMSHLYLAKAPRDAQPPNKTCRQCCCSSREWAIGFGIFVLLWHTVFFLGACFQAAISASDYNAYQPIGTVYGIDAGGGRRVNMHMRCAGPTDSGKPTFVFEHGGGSNCLALLGIADDLSVRHGRRTCVYDRMGYGWTPSTHTSFGTDSDSLDDSGVLAGRLLDAAGEAGPYVCVGHSAGGEACLKLGLAVGDKLVGVTILDGYPDLIRAGALRPGKAVDSASMIIGATQAFGVIAGPTGFTRGSVGNPGPNYVPQDYSSAMMALYAQTRFWLSQYWDVTASVGRGDAGLVYPKMNGVREPNGLISYGNTLSARVLVIPASSTTNATCTADYQYNDFCCKQMESSNPMQICLNNIEDSALYMQQSILYADTLGSSGRVAWAPRGTAHGFPYERQHYTWVVEEILKDFA